MAKEPPSDGNAAATGPSEEEQTARQIQSLLKPIPGDDRADAARLDELRRVFARLYQQQDEQLFSLTHWVGSNSSSSSNSRNKKNVTAAEQTWRLFLTKSHAKLRSQLSQRISQHGKRTAVRTFWGVVASSPRSCLVAKTNHHNNHDNHYQDNEPQRQTHALLDDAILLQWVQAMSRIPIWDKSIQQMVQAEFLEPFRDVQYYTMMDIGVVAKQLYKKISIQRQQQQQNDEDDMNTLMMNQRQAERLMQMLMAIPLASSQDQLDDSSSYLFQPPQEAMPLDETENDDEAAEDEDESSDDDDDDSSDDDSDDEAAALLTGQDEDDTPSPAAQKKNKDCRFPMQKLSCHRRQWSKAWMAILRLPCLPPHCLKRALQFLPTKVLPVVSRPLLFADFFMAAYTSHDDDPKKSKDEETPSTTNSSNNQSIIPLLALDGLFYLMTEHGLEYPSYYKQLYKIIRPIVFSVKSKTRFFQLLDKSISRNDLLSAHLVAAFCKRLMRCCLQGAPPAGILLAVVLVSNWCRKHSEVMALLHRGGTKDDDNANQIADKYNATTDDPSQANALQSSLWELFALQNHYYPAVATLAQSVGTPEEAKLPKHQLEDYLQLTYKTLLEQERKRQFKHHKKNQHDNKNDNSKKRKSSTPLTFQAPSNGLFGGKSVLSSVLALPPGKKTKSTSS